MPRLLRRVGTRGEYLFENIDRARFQGVETAVALRLPAGFAVNATCTYLDSRSSPALSVRLGRHSRETCAARRVRPGPGRGAWLGVVEASTNLGQLRLAEESPLFTGAEAPRTRRIALRGQR